MISFRKFLFIFFVFVLYGSHQLEKYYSQNFKINYLNYRAVGLNHHVISDKSFNPQKTMLMLGSSSLAGSNVPLHSTVTDFLNRKSSNAYFYNLGMLEGTLIDSYVFLKLALIERKPHVLVLGLNPDMFIDNYESVALASNYSLVENDFDKNFRSEASETFQNKLYFKFVLNLLGERTIPFQIILNLKHQFYFWQKKCYGYTYDSHVKEQGPRDMPFQIENPDWINRLDLFVAFAAKNNIKMLAYIEPTLRVHEFYKDHLYLKFKLELSNYFKKNKIKLEDFDQVIPNRPDYFIDYVHLTPKGNELLAEAIRKKLLDEELK